MGKRGREIVEKPNSPRNRSFGRPLAVYEELLAECKTYLVTGANGFIGQAACRSLLHRGLRVIGGIRDEEKAPQLPSGSEAIIISDRVQVSRKILEGVEGIIHLASRVHIMRDSAADPLEEFRKVNVLWTAALAEAAAISGVKRFIFLSSIKVHGERSPHPFTEQDTPAPLDPYSISKLEAEEKLKEVGAATGMEIVVLRPPLVYGEGVRANFLSLLRLVEKGFPLPLSSIDNQRSMIYRENLVDALCLCLDHPDAANQTFLVSDGKDFSTPELIRMIASQMGNVRTFFLFPGRYSVLFLLQQAGKMSTSVSAEIWLPIRAKFKTCWGGHLLIPANKGYRIP
jgi:nucleoside-diphosphate-sugar epimerase